MYFKSWLIKNHLHDRNPVGDLARDVKEDKKFPSRTNDRERIECIWNSAERVTAVWKPLTAHGRNLHSNDRMRST